MKALLLLSLLLSGVLAVTAAAVNTVEEVEAVKAAEAAPQELQVDNQIEAVEAAEAAEAAPQELQEDNQMVETEVEVVVPEVEEPEMVSAAEGRFFACPPGWVRYKNACYLFVSSGRSWSSAAAYCASLGASLASVHDVFDYSFLQQLTRRAGSSVSWMGGFYFQGWRWADQSSFNYNYWSSVNTVSRYPCIYLNAQAGWSNHNCGNGWPSICMKRTDGC